MAREPESFTVCLYGRADDFPAGPVGAEFIQPSRHQAVRQAAYALAGLAPCDAPAGRWAAAVCRACDGSWEMLFLGGRIVG